MITEYQMCENKAGSLLVTLLQDLRLYDIKPRITHGDGYTRLDCILHREYHFAFEGDPNGYRVFTMEEDVEKVVSEVKKWREENKELLDITRRTAYGNH